MLKKNQMSLVLFFLSFLSMLSLSNNSIDVEVLSYNIRYDNSKDGKNQ